MSHVLVSSIIPSKCILSFQRYFVGVASGKNRRQPIWNHCNSRIKQTIYVIIDMQIAFNETNDDEIENLINVYLSYFQIDLLLDNWI